MGVTLNGYLEVPEADRKTVEEHLPDHIRLTLKEPGCLSFDVRPDPQNHARFLVTEHFKDRPAFDAHQARVKASAWGAATKHLQRVYEVKG